MNPDPLEELRKLYQQVSGCLGAGVRGEELHKLAASEPPNVRTPEGKKWLKEAKELKKHYQEVLEGCHQYYEWAARELDSLEKQLRQEMEITPGEVVLQWPEKVRDIQRLIDHLVRYQRELSKEDGRWTERALSLRAWREKAVWDPELSEKIKAAAFKKLQEDGDSTVMMLCSEKASAGAGAIRNIYRIDGRNLYLMPEAVAKRTFDIDQMILAEGLSEKVIETAAVLHGKGCYKNLEATIEAARHLEEE